MILFILLSTDSNFPAVTPECITQEIRRELGVGRVIPIDRELTAGIPSVCSEYGQVAGTCECGNEPTGSSKCREFLDKLRTS